MDRIACGRVRESLRAHVAGELGGGVRSEIEAHVARCPPCAAEAARERALAAILEAFPAAPPVLPETPAFPAPAAETAHAPSLRRSAFLRAGACAATAAAIVVAAATWRADATRRAADVPAAFARFVDVDDPRPGWDERTLELAAGAEAVLMRRPAESR